MMDEQLKTNWNDFLETRRKRYFGELDSLFKDNPLYYYWSADETEWATDIMFKSRQKVDRLFPILSRYGFRNRDLCGWIYPEISEKSKEQKRRLSSRTSYLIRMLRAHGLVRKVPKENRYVLTKKGHEISTLVSTASHVDSQQLIKMAA